MLLCVAALAGSGLLKVDHICWKANTKAGPHHPQIMAGGWGVSLQAVPERDSHSNSACSLHPGPA